MNASRCWWWSSNWAMGRSARSVMVGRRTASGTERMCCWTSGARRNSSIT